MVNRRNFRGDRLSKSSKRCVYGRPNCAYPKRVHHLSREKIVHKAWMSFIAIVVSIAVIAAIIFGVYKFYGHDLNIGFGALSKESVQSQAKAHKIKHKYHFNFKVSDSEVDKMLRSMSLEDKVAQMFMVTPEQLLGIRGVVTSTGPYIRNSFYRIPVGGIMYKAENLQNPQQTKDMIKALQSISKARVGLNAFVSVDEEGGTVARVSRNPAMNVEKSPNMCDVGATKKPVKAMKIGKRMGEYLSDLGFNVDFAPDADVLTDPNNTLIKKRSFGSNPKIVTSMTEAFTEGLQSSNIFATYKHFPGHGSTHTDSHMGITISELSEEDLQRVDLKPFKDASEIGVQFIMVSHVSYPKVTGDNTPASVSEKIVTGLARNKLKYNGILISDSMGMGAITNVYGPGQAAVQGIRAGLDMLLSPVDLQTAYQSVLQAVRNKTISEKRIDESVRRILKVKLHLESQESSNSKKVVVPQNSDSKKVAVREK